MTSHQSWKPDLYAKHARFVAELGMPLITLLDPKPGEKILDLGCGDGVLTKKLNELTGFTIGVDASPSLVAAAKKLGLDVRLMDGQALTFENEFDAVFTNAALHWMKQADAVISGVWRALKTKGRFVGEMGGKGNVDQIRSAIHQVMQQKGLDPKQYDPWYFPSAEEYKKLLEKQGFYVDSIKLIPRPTPLPSDIIGWLKTFGAPFLADLPKTEWDNFMQDVQEILRASLCDANGKWTADYVRLRFNASKNINI